MSEKLNLGQIITTEQSRDAIHVAVAPVTAGEWLAPGTHVCIAASGLAVTAPKAECIGVVDPFLKQHVTVNDRFWLFLYPGSITSLRHDWTHPAIPAAEAGKPSGRSESEVWMRKWAMEHMSEDHYGDGTKRSEEVAYASAIEAGRQLHIGPYESARDYIDAEWWGHWENLTGCTRPGEAYFSCSC
jgi:hypothetical protein